MKLRLFYFIVAAILVLSFLAIYFILRNFGVKYDEGLASIIPKSQDPVSPRKIRTVRKVTIIQEEKGCMEVTPDGVVRTFESCGGELTDANRLADPKNILQLIQMASQIDVSLYRQKISGPYITLIIETDSGTETIYIPAGGGGPDGGGNEITEIIEQIEGDLPQPTATPGSYTATPTPTLGGVSNSPTPTPLISNTPGPSPTPGPTGTPGPPFTCGFTDDGTGKKPYNVSSVICSTEPTPAP